MSGVNVFFVVKVEIIASPIQSTQLAVYKLLIKFNDFKNDQLCQKIILFLLSISAAVFLLLFMKKIVYFITFIGDKYQIS